MTITGPSTSAVILAAGSSTRMEAAKQLLRIDGRPLLQHVLEKVCASEVRETILVLGASAEAIRQQIDLCGVRTVLNKDYQQGMASSLRVGLAAVIPEAEGALIVLADQPFVRSATLNQLIAEYRRSKAQIVIPTYRGFRGNPVLLDRSLFPEVMALRGDIGCRAIFGDHPHGIVKFPVDDVGILLDIDRKSDLETLRRIADRVQTEQALLETVDSRGRQRTECFQRPELVIVGRDAMALALAKLAQLLQFGVTVVDPLLAADKLPEADQVLHVLDFSMLPENSERYVVVASRGSCDEEAIEQALLANSVYVALVANRRRGEEILERVRMRGGGEKLARVRIPAGLQIGAETPEEIALSIMAQVVSVRRKSVGKI